MMQSRTSLGQKLVLASPQVAHSSVHRHHRCPRCGSLLARDERSGARGLLTDLLFLRGYRCTPECGWRGLRFSRSRFRRQKKRLRVALVVAVFILMAAATVRYVLSRDGSRSGGGGNEGIGEVDP